MKKYKYPKRELWKELSNRSYLEKKTLDLVVKEILLEVKTNKDKALFEYAEKFDKVILNQIEVTKKEVEKAKDLVSEELKAAIQLAKQNIEKFHVSQKQNEPIVETTK